MARKNREYGQTGIYHVILRGVNKQRIFEWPEDYANFLAILDKQRIARNPLSKLETTNFEIYAYCLMDNHIHLLLGEKAMSVSDAVRLLAGAYAQRFNLRYSRVGHLFQDRYKSTPCDDEKYFFTLLDYIHNNPVKAGISHRPQDYPYSSFRELTGHANQAQLCSLTPNLPIEPQEITTWVKGMSEVSEENSLQKMLSFLRVMCTNKKEVDPYKLDQTIVETLCRLSGASDMTTFQRLPKKEMREALATVRESGVSIRHLARLTGISEGIIRGAKMPNYTMGTVPFV